MDNMERARRFRQARTELNQHGKQTMQEVYQATGISASAICNLEKADSQRNPSEAVLRRLANHYGVNLAWLAGISSSWSQDEDSQSVTQKTGLSTEALNNLEEMMKDPETRDCVNILLASDEFRQMVSALKMARRYSGGREDEKDRPGMRASRNTEDPVDYQTIMNLGLDSGTLTFTESELKEMFLWKSTRIFEGFLNKARYEKHDEQRGI